MTESSLTTLFGDLTVVQAIVWFTAAAALIALVVKLWPVIKKFVATVDALADLPGKLALVDEIHHEVRPNTGSSLNDAVRRVEAEQHRQAKQLKEQSEAIAGLQSLMEDGDAELSERVGDIEKTINPDKE